MTHLSGGCDCGDIQFQVQFSQPLETFSPRACDCSFCQRHGAEYLSDPNGTLQFDARAGSLHRYHQEGDPLADFLICRNCGVFVGVLHLTENGTPFGALNRRALEVRDGFAPTVSVSPRLVSDEEKVKRWKLLWFPNVSVKNRP
jgi:hypothetical protein